MAVVAESLLMAHGTCLLILRCKLAMVVRKPNCMIETRINDPAVFFMTIRTDWPSRLQPFRVDRWKYISGALLGGTGIHKK
jgi:hypothetical protein